MCHVSNTIHGIKHISCVLASSWQATAEESQANKSGGAAGTR
jgi:hypothetical protein